MKQLIYFHDHALMIIVISLTVLTYIIIILIIKNLTKWFILEGQLIEEEWNIKEQLS